MSTKNIYTGVAVAGALIMVILVVIAINSRGEKETEKVTKTDGASVVATRIEVETHTDENGEIYTVLEVYPELGVSSDHTYKPTTKPSTTEITVSTEPGDIIYVTDPDGNIVYDENGNPVTEVAGSSGDGNGSEDVPPGEFETIYQEVTDENGQPVLDENGQPVTEVVTVPVTEEETTEHTTVPDVWDESSSGGDSGSEGFPKLFDNALANSIIAQANVNRAHDGGKVPLTTDEKLNELARADSLHKVTNNFSGGASGQGVTFVTSYGGSQLYADIKAALGDTILSDTATKIGVGVAKSGNKYYTTVIIK